MVVSSRPHAVYERWHELTGSVAEDRWRFVRVEPLGRRERELLLNQDAPEGVNRYKRLPRAGRALTANPRTIDYVRKLPVSPPAEPVPGPPGRRPPEPASVAEFTLAHMRTAAHVYAGATGDMIENRLRNSGAWVLGRPIDRHPKTDRLILPTRPDPGRSVPFAMDLLGVLAYAMYCLEVPGGSSGPNVSYVPNWDMPAFLEDEVFPRFRRSDPKRAALSFADLRSTSTESVR